MAASTISVVIPAFGRGDILAQAIRTAANQSLRPIEIIVVDDGSNPPLATADSMQVPVRLIRHDRNLGAASARNTGVAAASGDWIAFLDSDDFWRPGKLERQAKALDAAAQPLGVCVTGWVEMVDGRSRGAFVPSGARGLRDLSKGCWFCPGTTALLARETWEAVGGFDEGLERLEDYDWFLRFGSLGGGLVVVREPLAGIRWHRDVDPARVDRAVAALRSRYLPTQAAPGLDATARRNVAAYLWLVLAAARYYAGHRPAAGLALARSWVLKPRFGLQLAALISEVALSSEAAEELSCLSSAYTEVLGERQS